MEENTITSQTLEKWKRLRERLRSISLQLSAVNAAASQTADSVAKAATSITSAAKRIAAVATLLSFDEINRLQEKTTTSGTSTATESDDKTKTADADDGTLLFTLDHAAQPAAEQFWATFQTALEDSAGADESGAGLVNGLRSGISNALGNAAQWVRTNLWTPIKSGWAQLGTLALGVTAKLKTSASTLWSALKTAWSSGAERVVTVVNRLKSTAATLWENFLSAWGTRTVNIANRLQSTAATLWKGFQSAWSAIGANVTVVNALKSTAAELWSRFKSGWSGKTLSLAITYDTNVGSVKTAIYKALGLDGWPRISFAARGGIVSGATLLGSTVVGEDGAEAIIPLERHTEWIDRVAQRLASRTASTAPIVVQLTLDGKIVGQTSVEYINGQYRQGRSPLCI